MSRLDEDGGDDSQQDTHPLAGATAQPTTNRGPSSETKKWLCPGTSLFAGRHLEGAAAAAGCSAQMMGPGLGLE